MKRLRQEIARRKRRDKGPRFVYRLEDLQDKLSTLRLPDRATLEIWKQSYLAVREVALELNDRQFFTSLPKDAITFAASSLGLLHHNTIVLNNEGQFAVVADFAIFNHRVNGKNAVERYVEEHAREYSPLQLKWLHGAANSRYTLLLLGVPIPEVGVRAVDILTGDQLVITDVNISRSNVVGLTLATRIIPIDEFYITGCAPLPVFNAAAILRIGQYLARTCSDVKDFRTLAGDRATWMEANIIRAILEEQGTERVKFVDP